MKTKDAKKKSKAPNAGASLPGELTGSTINGFPIRRVLVSDLIEAGYNPRIINDAAKAGLKRSVDEFGLVEAIVWNKRTQRIVGGHQRKGILEPSTYTEVVEVDLPESKEKVLNLGLNNPHTQGEWTTTLGELLAEVQAELPELTTAMEFDALHEDVARVASMDLGDINDVDMGGEGGDNEAPAGRGSKDDGEGKGGEDLTWRLEIVYESEKRRDAALATLRAVNPSATLAECLEDVLAAFKGTPKKKAK